MDLALLTTSDTADCVIMDPVTKEPTDIVITVYGSHTDEYLSALRIAASQSESIKEITSEADKKEAEKQAELSFLVDLTAGWSGIEVNGKKFPFNKKNALSLYKESALIRKRVDVFIAQIENFLPQR